jgi:hypothetical protein
MDYGPSSVASCAWRSQVATNQVTTNNTPIHNILSTDPQLSISQKALETLPEDGNVMPKHVGATVLTPHSTVLLEKLTSLCKQSRKSPHFYGTVKFITVLTSRGKQRQTTPKNFPRMQHARAIPVT